MNQKKYTIYIKQLIDGMPSAIFSASTFPPHKKDKEIFLERYEKILQVSRERYTKPRAFVEGKISSFMHTLEKEETAWALRKEEFKKQKQQEKKTTS